MISTEIFKHIPLSVNKAVSDAGFGLAVTYEGQKRQLPLDEPCLHVHVIGPNITCGSGSDVLTIRLKIVVSVPETDQGYLIYEICGKIAVFMREDIPLFDDNYQAINCLNQTGEIFINHFGKVDPDLPLRQSTVETSYKVYLSGD